MLSSKDTCCRQMSVRCGIITAIAAMISWGDNGAVFCKPVSFVIRTRRVLLILLQGSAQIFVKICNMVCDMFPSAVPPNEGRAFRRTSIPTSIGLESTYLVSILIYSGGYGLRELILRELWV